MLNPWVIGIIILVIIGLIIFVPIIGIASLVVVLPLIGCVAMCGAMAIFIRSRKKEEK